MELVVSGVAQELGQGAHNVRLVHQEHLTVVSVHFHETLVGQIQVVQQARTIGWQGASDHSLYVRAIHELQRTGYGLNVEHFAPLRPRVVDPND
jgi:hypothetical protein